jgi:endonuclease/exonuclease/phosphatase family metal-dependent hydrolase
MTKGRTGRFGSCHGSRAAILTFVPRRGIVDGVQVAVGTFNLNNLFSRFNFEADVSTAKIEQQTSFTFDDPSGFKLRKYMGRLVTGKPEAERKLIAARIKRMDLDVLAVQEVEDIDTLRQFARDDLAGLYKHIVLIEGNDPRLIDIGLLSKLPLGGVTSWQHVPDPLNPDQPVFSRDLLQVEILKPDRSDRLLTVFNNHLKSHYVPFTEDPEVEGKRANELRKRQCEAVATIIEAETRPDSGYVVVGDMNDPPDSEFMAPLADSPVLQLKFGLEDVQETQPGPGNPPPPSPNWTERFKPTGKPAEYTLMDQVWLSPALAPKKIGAFIDRRSKVGGDGSDHDPSWVTLDL